MKKELPEEWRWSTIEEVCKTKPRSGGTPLTSNSNFYGGNIPWVITEDLTNAGMYISQTQKKITKEGLENSNAQYFPKDTILFAMYGSIGRMSISTIELTTNQAILGLIPDREQVITKYLYYYLTFVKEIFIEKGRGGTQSNINAGMLCNFPIIVPPITQQQKIADKLDIQMAQIEMMKKEAEEQMESANYYYRSYLLKVFSEKDNWQFIKFGDLFNTKYGLSKPSVRDSSKTKALRMSNINYEGELILDDVCYLDLSDDELKQHKLKKNDLIFNRTNSADLVGKTTVFDQEDTFVSVSYLVVATPKTPEINSKFVSFYLNTSEMKKYFIENCDKAISQANFSASKLCEIKIPVPDKKLQDKIVGSIQTAKTELMRVSEPIKSQLDAINKLPNSLPNSLLNEVFGQYQINS